MQPIRWLWGCADHKSHVRIITAMVISAVTSLMLLVNPSLTATLVDEVIIAENPEPLLGILAVMLIVKLAREGARYSDDRIAGNGFPEYGLLPAADVVRKAAVPGHPFL